MTDEKQVVNQQIDVGALLVEDCQSYEGVSTKQFQKRTANNLCALYRKLFELKKAQSAQFGEDGEVLEHTKALNYVELPAPKIIIPREKPIPKEKVKTRWERFREERGLPPRKKRSRLVYDGQTQEWLPRWGPGSVKKVHDDLQWIMEEKPKHVEAGLDPYAYEKQEKRKVHEKQKLAELKNKVRQVKPSDVKQDKVLGKSEIKEGKDSLKTRPDAERDQIRKREHKALMKSLTLAQMSTASMGKFDKKVSKKEPDAPTTQKKPKKKSSAKLHELDTNKTKEKERNLKILETLQKKVAQGKGGKVNAGINEEKAAKKAITKDNKQRRRSSHQ